MEEAGRAGAGGPGLGAVVLPCLVAVIVINNMFADTLVEYLSGPAPKRARVPRTTVRC